MKNPSKLILPALGTISPTANATFQSASLDLSTLSANALDDQSTIFLRMTISTPNTGGSYAFDNIQMTGTAVPEPSAAALLGGLGGLLLIRRRRY